MFPLMFDQFLLAYNLLLGYYIMKHDNLDNVNTYLMSHYLCKYQHTLWYFHQGSMSVPTCQGISITCMQVS